MWHVSDTEATAWPADINNRWMTGSELLANCVPHETQFVWGVLDAFVPGANFEIVEIPFADGNTSLWAGAPLAPQIGGASFEIVYWDSCAVFVIGLQERAGSLILDLFPDAKKVP